MKKFLVYLVVIIAVVSVGFTVFYLVKDNEKVSITASSIYLREGDTTDELNIVWERKKAFSDYEVISSNEGIAKYDVHTQTLTGISGGIATITFRTSNINFRNLSCQVYVGNGSIQNPYYIKNAEQLREIGATINGEVKYGLDKCYKLVNDINLADGYNNSGYWIPIGTSIHNDSYTAGFSGSFDGNGNTISNIMINKQEYFDAVERLGADFVATVPGYRTYTDAGLFGRIDVNGRVVNLKIDNFNATGDIRAGETSGNGSVGAISGLNYGTIERVEVLSAYINVTNVDSVGGITGLQSSVDRYELHYDEEGEAYNEYVRYTARIDRCSANVYLGIDKNYVEGEIVQGAEGNVGGICGQNTGGIVIYSYSKGEAHLNRDGYTSAYGGIVGVNNYLKFYNQDDKYLYDYSGGHIKDCYSTIKLRKVNSISIDEVGGIIGLNLDRLPLDLDVNTVDGAEALGFVNKIIGNYYLIENLNYNGDVTTDVDTYYGCGQYHLLSQDAFEDKQYILEGKTSSQLQLTETYLSHQKTDSIKNEDTGELLLSSSIALWKFDRVWFISENLNDGYPVLNFANIEVSDDLYGISDGVTITSVQQLYNMHLDGHYYISNDITFPSDSVWIPKGTVANPFVGTLKSAAYIKDGKKQYYKIYNLKTSLETDLEKIQREQLTYAGIFGVTNGSKGGVVENVELVNPTIANGRVVGGIVASNGYTVVKDGKATTYGGLTIKNCKIIGGVLRGTYKVGAIAGENMGTIENCLVGDYIDSDFNIVNKVRVILYGDSEGYAGGMAGINRGVIAKSNFTGGSSVVATSGNALIFNTYVGGITGENSGTINTSVVDSNEGVAIDKLKGSIGGIAGINKSVIENVVAQTAVYAPINNEQVFAGGIVGSLVSEGFVTKSLVKNSIIRGYNAGGIAGIVNYSTPNGYKYNLSVNRNYQYSLTNSDVDTISESAVEEGTSVEGMLSAGIAAIVDNGIIRNCYTRAYVNGINNNSVKAGFVVDLNLNKNTKDVAIIINCYSAATFANENGKNYTVTPKEILKDPVFDLNISGLSRTAGYCFNYVFAQQGNASDPEKDLIINIFNPDKSGTSLSNMKGTAPKQYTERGFSQTYWKFNANALPTLKSLEELQSIL